MSTINLTINDKAITAREGQTILEVTLENGYHVPRLCYDPRVSPSGSCRLCIVEIEGEGGLHTSCTRLATEGMKVATESPTISASRKMTLEFLLSEHDARCTSCDSDGDCALQDYSYEYGADLGHFGSLVPEDRELVYTGGHRGIVYDPTKCVRCQLCVKICSEVAMVDALTLKGRSLDVRVSTAFDLPLNETGLQPDPGH